MNEKLIKEVEEFLNSLLQATFQMNSHADNCAYWLASNNFVNTSKVFHERYAHKFPELADAISDFMIKLGMKPIRKALEENDYDYSDYIELFEDVETELVHYREIIYKTIDTIEKQNMREIVSFLDEYLLKLIDYINQVVIWENKANDIGDNYSRFDKYFESFTII